MKKLALIFSGVCLLLFGVWYGYTQCAFITQMYVVEGYVMGVHLEQPMEQFYQQHGFWPQRADIQAQPSLMSKSTSQVASTQIAPNGTIVVLFSLHNRALLQVKTIELKPLLQSNGHVLWLCSSNIENSLLPLSCQSSEN